MLPKFIRFKDLKRAGIVDNYVTLGRWIDEQGFPPGRLLGPNVRAWTDEEITAWLATRPVARIDADAA